MAKIDEYCSFWRSVAVQHAHKMETWIRCVEGDRLALRQNLSRSDLSEVRMQGMSRGASDLVGLLRTSVSNPSCYPTLLLPDGSLTCLMDAPVAWRDPTIEYPPQFHTSLHVGHQSVHQTLSLERMVDRRVQRTEWRSVRLDFKFDIWLTDAAARSRYAWRAWSVWSERSTTIMHC